MSVVHFDIGPNLAYPEISVPQHYVTDLDLAMNKKYIIHQSIHFLVQEFEDRVVYHPHSYPAQYSPVTWHAIVLKYILIQHLLTVCLHSSEFPKN